jgi:hypothetical protein
MRVYLFILPKTQGVDLVIYLIMQNLVSHLMVPSIKAAALKESQKEFC